MRNSAVVIAVTAAAFAAAIVLAPSTGACEESETQLWLGLYAEVSVLESLTLGMSAGVYFDYDMTHFYSWDAEGYVTWAAFSWLSLVAGYNEIRDKVETDEGVQWSWEHKPYGDIVPRLEVGGWVIQDRNRVEYIMVKDEDPYFRYRNRIILQAPWRWTVLQINAYGGYELFLSNRPLLPGERRRIEKQRILLGFTFMLDEHITGDCYYIRQLDWAAISWESTNVIGLSIGLVF